MVSKINSNQYKLNEEIAELLKKKRKLEYEERFLLHQIEVHKRIRKELNSKKFPPLFNKIIRAIKLDRYDVDLLNQILVSGHISTKEAKSIKKRKGINGHRDMPNRRLERLSKILNLRKSKNNKLKSVVYYANNLSIKLITEYVSLYKLIRKKKIILRLHYIFIRFGYKFRNYSDHKNFIRNEQFLFFDKENRPYTLKYEDCTIYIYPKSKECEIHINNIVAFDECHLKSNLSVCISEIRKHIEKVIFKGEIQLNPRGIMVRKAEIGLIDPDLSLMYTNGKFDDFLDNLKKNGFWFDKSPAHQYLGIKLFEFETKGIGNIHKLEKMANNLKEKVQQKYEEN